MNLYNLLQASLSDPNSPNILLTVSLSDLHQFVVDTIDATRDRLLPLFMKAEEDRLLTKAEVCAKLGIKPTSVWNLVQNHTDHQLQEERARLQSPQPQTQAHARQKQT